MADVSVRPARLGDVAGLTTAQLDAWESSGLPGQPDQVEAERAWERAVLVPPSPRHRVLVALDGDDVVGAAASVPAADPDLSPTTDTEVVLLVVAPRLRGRGHGSRLLMASVEAMRSCGETLAVAWVPARDDETRRFLVGAGWAPDGAHREAQVDESPPVRWLRLATVLREGPA
jgi:GNAT superfamily N-acetyltransferase